MRHPALPTIASLVALSFAGVTARVAVADGRGPRYLTPARSVTVLRAAFGGVTERPIREPPGRRRAHLGGDLGALGRRERRQRRLEFPGRAVLGPR